MVTVLLPPSRLDYGQSVAPILRLSIRFSPLRSSSKRDAVRETVPRTQIITLSPSLRSRPFTFHHGRLLFPIT